MIQYELNLINKRTLLIDFSNNNCLCSYLNLYTLRHLKFLDGLGHVFQSSILQLFLKLKFIHLFLP